MAYDEKLATRIRAVIASEPGLTEKKMFGGVGFMLRGNMACGVHGNDMIVRIGPDQYEQALALPHVRPFDMTGRPMAGWIVVEAAGVTDADALSSWVRRGVAHASTLPEK